MKQFLLLLIVGFITIGFAQKKAITFEDFFAMKRIGHVAVSPDQKLVAYDLKTPDIEKDTYKTDVWILDLETGETKQLTMSDKSSSHPVWAPDGKSIYVNRGEQIWNILKDGTEKQVTSFTPGAANVIVSSDGSKILFKSTVDPNCQTTECMEKSLKADAAKTSKAKIINTLFYRYWDSWLDGKRSHVFIADSDGTHVMDLTPGDYDTPPLDLGSSQDYVFAPDGSEICFVRNMDEMVAASTNNDVFSLDLKTKKITKISSSKGNDNHPVYSPDGRYIAFSSMERAGYESDREKLMLYDRTNKTTMDISKDWDYSVAQIVWHPSGKEIFVRVPEKGNYSIYRVSLEEQKFVPVFKGKYIGTFDFLDDERLILKIQSAKMPYELFSYSMKNEKLQKLTSVNDALISTLDMSDLEEFWFEGAKGNQVHGWMLKPPQFDASKKYPSIQLIHGGPHGAWGDNFHYRWNYQMFANAGYVVYAINFHASKGYGQDFSDAIIQDWGGAPYEDIVKGTDYVIKNYPFIDADRLGAAGASYGGFMINWINGHENPFKCLVSHDGVYDQVSMYGATEELWFPEWEMGGTFWDNPESYSKWSPSRLAKNFKTPTLVIHGELDYRVPYTQGLQMYTALKRQGVDAQLLFFPDEDHWVMKPQNAKVWWETVHAWFDKYLGE